VSKNYTPTIGIECHVQLMTKTKLFAAVGNDAREAPANTLISHICLGMPGALPVLNKGAVDLAIKAAYALGTKPQRFSAFDRKHYFYPDLPMGYQISQLYHPIILGGHVNITVDGKQKKIGITRAHLEADAGKSTHPAGKDYSLVDLNRAGTPLLEIVSEPDIHSPAEAKAYAHELYLLMKYAGVSDANLYYGNMRFDVNVSVSADPDKLGNRTETKNLNSFRSVEKAVEYEIKRQTEVLEKGGEITQETRGWDDAKQKTFTQRSKEEAQDYRYFPDPDIPPVVLDDRIIEEAIKSSHVMPDDVRSKLQELNIDESAIETIVDSVEIIDEVLLIIDKAKNPDISRRIILWFVGVVQTIIDESYSWEQVSLSTKIDHLLKLSEMQEDGLLSSTAAKEILLDVLRTDKGPEEIAKNKNLIQLSDSSELETIVGQVLADNKKAAEDVKNGEMKAIGFLVGQVMKESKGKANPGIVQKIIRDMLA
jgi:aspartyl-tRNA(Asn)/glutamyl-tRNA(Gln) amidotransferase subunit B